MVDIQSKEVIDKISEELKIQPALSIPREISKNIQLTYGVNPKLVSLIVRDGTRTLTGSEVIFTTSSVSDFYLVSVAISNQSNATADNTSVFIQGTPRGKAVQNFLLLSKLTTTATTSQNSINPVIPVLLDRASTIVFGSAFTVGASSTSINLIGYEVDPQ